MANYIAEPLSRKQLRALALSIRRIFKLENELYFPITKMLEAMPNIFEDERFTFEIVPDNELPPSVQADTDVANHYMRIKESVYDGACADNGRDRYSIAHEIGHYILMNVLGLQFQRNIAHREVHAYEDPEWQAECFAGELLMPHHLVIGMTPQEISAKCKVSYPAACTQAKHL